MNRGQNRFFYAFFYALGAALLLPTLGIAQKASAGHPDFSGIWQFSIGLPSTALIPHTRPYPAGADQAR